MEVSGIKYRYHYVHLECMHRAMEKQIEEKQPGGVLQHDFSMKCELSKCAKVLDPNFLRFGKVRYVSHKSEHQAILFEKGGLTDYNVWMKNRI